MRGAAHRGRLFGVGLACATARLTPWIEVETMGLYVMLAIDSTLESAP